MRQIILKENKEYLEYTNNEERNSRDLQLHSFLIQQNLKQYDEAMQKITKKKPVPLEEILNPDAFYSNRSKVSTQMTSSRSKHPLSASVIEPKHRSRSQVNSSRMSYADRRYSILCLCATYYFPSRSPDTRNDGGVDEFESLHSELASLYNLKPKQMPNRKIVSADKFKQMINHIGEPKTERGPLRSQYASPDAERNVSPEDPRRSRSTQKSSIKVRKSAQGDKGEKGNNDEDYDEIADIDRLLNMSLSSKFEIDEEDDDDQEEQEKKLEVHFAQE